MVQSVSVSSLFGQYLNCQPLAESSVAIKSRAFRYFIKLFGDIAAKVVNYGHAEDYRNWLAKDRSMQSANIYLKNFTPFWAWLVRRGFIKVNPFAEVQPYKIGEKQKPVFTPDEIERIMKVADLRWQVIVLLALCSLRRAEVLNLVVKDIDFAKSYILISPKMRTTETWNWNIKNHNQAIVPLPEVIAVPDMQINLHQLLMRLIDELPQGQPYVCLPPNWYQKNIELQRAGKMTFENRICPWGNFNPSISARDLG